MIKIRITAEKDPVNLKWNEVDVDVVAECTGFFTTKTLHTHTSLELRK
jgi:glyceraldehyde-3-phosphate dehydrogenase/erythrose-4-phosphate dehydrogenase